MMRKMMSIVFLLLVLLISLGLNAYLQLTEGMENEEVAPGGDTTEQDQADNTTEEETLDEKVEPTDSVVAPAEDSCTETMTTYR